MGIVNDATMHLALNIYCMMGQLSAPPPPPAPSGSIPLKLRIKLRF